MKLTARQQIALTTSALNVFLLAIILGAFTLFTQYLLEKNLETDLIVEAEEIVTQHLGIEDGRIKYLNSTSGQTIEQDLLTDRLSAMIVNLNAASVGKFGVFARPTIPEFIDLSIRKTANEACKANTYSYKKDQYIDSGEYTYLYYPINKTGKCYGTIVVAGDTKSLSEISQITLTLSLIAIALATLLNLLLGKFIASSILRPLHQLSSRMQQVNLETETPKLNSPYARNDEISGLIDTFNSMAQRVSETALTQKSFIIDASHELKTPIARAVTDLDLIRLELETLNAKPKTIESLNQAQADLKSIATIINTLLQATKLKQVSLNLTSNSLQELINAEIEPLQKTYRAMQIQLDSRLKNELVLADKQVLVMILRNCLVNAFKYNISKGSVFIRVKSIGNTYAITIENTTAQKGESVKETESYKLGFDIIRNLCAITKYEFISKRSKGHFSIVLSNIPQTVISE